MSSVFIVGSNEISALVAWADACDLLPNGLTAQDVAQLLYAANVRSYNERYQATEPEPISEVFANHAPTQAMEQKQAPYFVERLEYQCDSWRGWEGSTEQKTIRSWARLVVALQQV